MITTLTAVLVDGSSPVGAATAQVPTVQDIVMPQGEDATINLKVVNTANAAVNLTGGNITMAVSKTPIDASTVTATISRQAVIDNAALGLAHFTLIPADTEIVPTPPNNYRYDAVYTDSAGKRWQVIPLSTFVINPSAVAPNAPVTVPPANAPLAQGPQGPAGVGTLQQAAVSLAQRGTINFVSAARITAVDNVGATRTDIDLAATAVTPGAYTNANVTVDAYGRLTAVASGGAGLPAFPGGGLQYFLTETSGATTWGQISQDMIISAFTAALAPNGFSQTQEVGANIVNPAFTASYNRTAVAATLNDGSGAVALTVAPYTSFGYNVAPLSATTYTRSAINGSYTWTLTANETGGPSKTSVISATWYAKNYWGTQTPATLNAAFITGLASNGLAGGFATGGIAMGAGGGTEKFYYAFPASEGTPSVFKDTATGFSVDMTLAASNISVTNATANPVAILYNIWVSVQFQSGALTMSVA